MEPSRFKFYLSHTVFLHPVDFILDANSSQLIAISSSIIVSHSNLDMHQIIVVGGGAAGLATAARNRVDNFDVIV